MEDAGLKGHGDTSNAQQELASSFVAWLVTEEDPAIFAGTSDRVFRRSETQYNDSARDCTQGHRVSGCHAGGNLSLRGDIQLCFPETHGSRHPQLLCGGRAIARHLLQLDPSFQCHVFAVCSL